MLGVILPILGLVITPLAVSFMENARWYYFAVLYNVALPGMVFYLGKTTLSTRPSGYGDSDMTDLIPDLKKHKKIRISSKGKDIISIDPLWFAIFIGFVIVMIGISPLILHKLTFTPTKAFDIVINEGIKITQDPRVAADAPISLLGYKKISGAWVGPFGLGSTLLSLLVPLGVALAIGFYYNNQTKNLIKIREKTKALEKEFGSALFQLGNRMGDGLPAEIAFSKVSEIMNNTNSGDFFNLVSANISRLGLGVEGALFHKKYGAINKFPSPMIKSSMKVFIESAKKGPQVASQALLNISRYIKEMHRVDERLKDLMAEVTSSMRSQISFLAPLISGIVIGLTSMITTILNTIRTQMEKLQAEGGGVAMEGIGGDMFKSSIPTFYFQIVVGLYIVQITYLLTTMLNTIENGYDPLSGKNMLGKHVKKSGVLYTIISFVTIMLFNLIATIVISQMVI